MNIPYLPREVGDIPNRLRGAVGSKRIKGVSPSADGDLRNFFEKKFLKDLQKTFSLLLFLVVVFFAFEAEGCGECQYDD